jgi:hypothetical protein
MGFGVIFALGYVVLVYDLLTAPRRALVAQPAPLEPA